MRFPRLHFDDVLEMGQDAQPVLNNEDVGIRLICLIEVDRDGYMNFSLRSTSINFARYTALSYVWGRGPPSHTIRVNGQVVWIRSNLWLFFATCAQHILDRDFWIDALCIDQSDVKDKSRQIPLMGRIYAQAQQVKVWLDVPSTERPVCDRESGYAALHALLDLSNAHTEGKCSNIPGTDSLPSKQTELVIGALLRLVAHEYWSRLWIVQELQLAGDVVIQYGPVLLTHAQLTNLLDDIACYPEIETTIQKNFPEGLQTLLRPLWKTPSTQDRGNDRLCLFELVIMHADRKCSIPYDHVYGLLSLALEGSKLLPDYEQTHLELLTQLFRCSPRLPSETQLMQILSLLDVDLTYLELPIYGMLKSAWFPTRSDEHFEYQATLNYTPKRVCQLLDMNKPSLLIGVPRYDLLFAAESVDEWSSSVQLVFVIAPNRVKRVLNNQLVRVEDLITFKGSSTFQGPSSADPLRRIRCSILDGWKNVSVQFSLQSLHAFLGIGFQPDCLRDFFFPMSSCGSLGEVFIEVNEDGRPLRKVDLACLVPRIVLIESSSGARKSPVQIENIRIRTWGSLRQVFQTAYFKDEYRQYLERNIKLDQVDNCCESL